MGNLETMGAHEIPSTMVQSILASARRFGLSEAATWGAMDDALLAVGSDATVAEYFDELAGRLAELTSRQESFSWEALDVPEGTPRFFPFGFEWRELPGAWQGDGVRFSLEEMSGLVDLFGALVRSCSCYRLETGRDLASLAAVLRGLLQSDTCAMDLPR